MEKLSKESLDALWNLVSGSRRVTVVSHTHPDGDAVGSCVAMCSWLGSLGKDALMMLPTPVPSSLDFILGGQVPMIYSLSPRECAHRLMSSDLVICLDLNSLSRVEDMEQAINVSPCRRVSISSLRFLLSSSRLAPSPESSSCSRARKSILSQFPPHGPARPRKAP